MNQTALLIDPTNTSTLRVLADRRKDLRSLAFSPIAFLDDDSHLEELLSVPGVVGHDSIGDLTFRILCALDGITALAARMHPEWTFTGIAPGEPYPRIATDTPDGIPQAAPPAGCAAVSISLTPRNADTAPLRPDDAVNHMTRFLSDFTVPVIAVGNDYRGQQFETVSPWAEPPWVLSVGATEDPAATRVAPYSNRASTRAPDVGPDVLAYGASALDDTVIGTSFATPRVAYMIGLSMTWLHQVLANVTRLRRQPYGVPLLGCAIVDTEGSPYGDPAPTYQAMPVLPINPAVAHELDSAAAAFGRYFTMPADARALLMAAAEQHGRDALTNTPCIAHASLIEFLSTLTVPHLFSILSGSPRPAGAGSPPIFLRDTVIDMDLYYENTVPKWLWCIDTNTSQMAFGQRDTRFQEATS